MPEPVKLNYIKDDNYHEYYCTGIFGAITSHGILKAMFFEDTFVLPEYEILDGTEVKERSSNTKEIVDRVMKCGIVIQAEQIPSIISWLDGHYKKYKDKAEGDLNAEK